MMQDGVVRYCDSKAQAPHSNDEEMRRFFKTSGVVFGSTNDDLEEDFSAALAELNNFSEQPEPSSIEPELLTSLVEESEEPDKKSEIIEPARKKVSTKKIASEQLLALYIMADQNKAFKGPEILKAVESVNMIYGSMKIFHHYGDGKERSKQALFSLLNIVEPGYFDFNQIEKFSTRGLALFMRLPAVDDGEMVFNKMLETAWQLAKMLDGELHDADHNFLDPGRVNSMREKASLL